MRLTLRHLGCATLASLAVAATGLGAVPGVGALRSSSPLPQAGDKAKVAAGLGNLPLSFVENRGQVAGPARYYVQGAHTSVYFANDGITYSLTQSKASSSAKSASAAALDGPVAPSAPTRAAVKLDFVGAAATEPTAGAPAPGVVSYFGSTPDKSHTAIPTYAGVTYHDLWPGIDAVYSGTGSALEYTFVVHPGADPSQIRLAYRGAERAHLNDQGQLEVTTSAGGFTDDRPTSYQDLDGTRVPVSSNWAADPADGTFALPVGSYDATRDLVIDPVQFVYAGYLGGDAMDYGLGIAVDASGSAYITGATYSTESTFPAAVGPDVTYNGFWDVFVAKLNPAGTGLDYAGFIGGTSWDDGSPADQPPGNPIAVDTAGNAYITGITNSSDFPLAGNPSGLTSSLRGSLDAFVTKVNAAGTGLVYSGYLGGNSSDRGRGIAVDATGNAYVTGNTISSDFPVAVGPSTAFNGAGQGQTFVTKLSPTASTLYSGFVGNADIPHGIAVDVDGSAYVTGEAFPATTFAASAASFDPTYNGGGTDAFVAKVNSAGTGLDYAGFIGGTDAGCEAMCFYAGFDVGAGVAVDATGHYVTGFTHPAGTSFSPTAAVGPDLTYNGGPFDGFVVKLNPAGTAADYAGFIGGGSMDRGQGIAVGSDGAAYISGWTSSYQKIFPAITKNAPDSTFQGTGSNGFVAKVVPNGAGFAYVTYVGGYQTFAQGIAVDAAGSAYVTGLTSADQLAPGIKGIDYRYHDHITHRFKGIDAFVVKISG